nr:arf-GAP domain and FG repeat-containing protein 1-like isoform X2 [Misgurnus anguillicaudatus]
MAASAKRKQEEKHLKMLREMTSLPPNRKCFDCDQRGPTYANMTVGSFVCTTCSGILRGLNPPHRVKSISMTTFTQQEIEFLQKHNNEVCKHIWLGLYDDKSSVIPDFREPQKVKEFLQEKYEKKRWYVPPEQAKVLATVQASISGSSASSTSSTPEVLPQPLKTLHLTKTPTNQSPVTSRAQAQSAGQEKKFDLLSDLGGDIFAAPPAQTASSSNFANFAHFNRPSGGGMSVPPLPSMALPQGGMSKEDRYAALAELDSALSFSTSSGGPGPQGNVFGGVPAAAAPPPNQPGLPNMQQGFAAAPSTNPFVAAGMVQEPVSTNPFQTNGRASAAASFGTGSMSMPAGFGNTTSYCLPTSFSGTFQQQFPGQGPFPPPAAYHQQPNGGFPTYGQAKPMGTYGQTGPGISSNPFMGGGPAGPYQTGGSSTNPFL